MRMLHSIHACIHTSSLQTFKLRSNPRIELLPQGYEQFHGWKHDLYEDTHLRKLYDNHKVPLPRCHYDLYVLHSCDK